MSGYAGMVRTGGGGEAAAEDAHQIENMAARIAFRGPDARQVWHHPDVHFCFSLLKTGPAPQAAVQPCTLDGRVWLLGDVRLDGRDEVIRRFAQRGEKLPSATTDEELALHVFHAYGESGVAELDGDYSIALWDSKNKKLLGFRDPTGSKPFFYFAGNGTFYFSNTLDALRESAGFDGSLDEHFLADYLLEGWCPDGERTIYRQIRKLAPGHLLEYCKGERKVRRAAQLPIEELILYKREEEYEEHYKEILHEAVKDRLASEETVVFMSGGLDSTTVAAEAKRICARAGGTRSVSALSLDYRPLFDDREGEEARQVAQYLKIPFELLHGGDCEPFSGWDAAGFPMPEPRHEPFQAVHVACHQAAAQRARVMLSGDGGDDVLLGQAWPYLRHLLKKGKWITAIGAVTGHIWNTRRLPVLGLGIRSGIRNRFGERSAPVPFPEWCRDEFVTRLNLRERFAELQKKPTSEHPTHPFAYAMLTGPFWPNILDGENAEWSGAALEVRAPLLDRRMVRYLLRLPAMPWCMDKQLVQRAMVGELPNETLQRPKTPLAADPVELHIKERQWNPAPTGELAAPLGDLIDQERLQASLERSAGESMYAALRPVSLDRWLKSVEMPRRIQYSR
jgi:asparagine synthase (glutamine-hydrolysing)